MSRPRLLALSLCLLAWGAFPTLAKADFGFVPDSLFFAPERENGTLETQAGSHPYAFVLHFELKTDAEGKTEGGELREAITDLPPGMLGNPAAVPTCPRQSFEGPLPDCPPGTQVGVLRTISPGLKSEAFGPIYNLTPPPGVVAQLGFSADEYTALLTASVRTEDGYGVRVRASNVPLESSSVTATIWGTPADKSHDPERGHFGGEESNEAKLPFFTLPTSCDSPPRLDVQVDSKLAPGAFVPASAFLLDEGGAPQPLSGCEAVPFSPEALAGPTTAAAESPAGLGFSLAFPNEGLLNDKEGAVSETQPVRTEVTLPPGITANPAAVNGQGVCTLDQYKAASAISGPGQGCPESSKIGTLTVHTPLLQEAIEGSFYLAAPHDNPFNSLLALYIVAEAPQRGALAKQAGLIETDPVSGQLKTTFDDLPPIPYSGFEVHLREGPRAPLITPPTCGPYTTTVKLYSFAEPGTPVQKSAPFTINSGAGGAPCASSEAQLPFAPTLTAGTTVPIAGSYSPFVFKIARNDGEQRFGSLAASLPRGLVGAPGRHPLLPGVRDRRRGGAHRRRTRRAGGSLPLLPRGLPGRHRGGRSRCGPDPLLRPRQRLPRRPLQRRPAQPGDHHPGDRRAL